MNLNDYGRKFLSALPKDDPTMVEIIQINANLKCIESQRIALMNRLNAIGAEIDNRAIEAEYEALSKVIDADDGSVFRRRIPAEAVFAAPQRRSWGDGGKTHGVEMMASCQDFRCLADIMASHKGAPKDTVRIKFTYITSNRFETQKSLCFVEINIRLKDGRESGSGKDDIVFIDPAWLKDMAPLIKARAT